MLLNLDGWSSLLLSAGLAFSFVASLYVWKESATLDRDHPLQVKRRLISIGIFTALSHPVLFMFDKGGSVGAPFHRWIGCSIEGSVWAMFLPLLLTMLLFLGPLVDYGLAIKFDVFEVVEAAKLSFNNRLLFMRTYVVAPLCEEAIYRVLFCTVLIAGGWSYTSAGLLSPVLFGVAHLHHLTNLVRIRGYSVQQGAMLVAFQLFYTTVFGLYASFLFIRTGHLLACFIPHAFCNIMGFPSMEWVNGPNKVLVGSMYLVGIVLFSYCLYPLTEPSIYSSFIWNDLPGLYSGTTKFK